jgi:hypothetical protein
MNNGNRRLRVILSVLGLVCVLISIVLAIVAAGTFWN